MPRERECFFVLSHMVPTSDNYYDIVLLPSPGLALPDSWGQQLLLVHESPALLSIPQALRHIVHKHVVKVSPYGGKGFATLLAKKVLLFCSLQYTFNNKFFY